MIMPKTKEKKWRKAYLVREGEIGGRMSRGGGGKGWEKGRRAQECRWQPREKREEKSRKGVARRIFTNLTLPATTVLSATGREPHAHQLHGSVAVLRAKTCLRIRK